MARTKDLVLLANGVVYRVSKSNYKRFLEARLTNGSATLASVGAKMLIVVDKDVTSLTLLLPRRGYLKE